MKKIFLTFTTLTLLASSQSFSTEIGLRNVNLIPYALESATNVSRLELPVRTTFNNVKGTFPKKGELSELNDLLIVSLMNYNGEFCKLMINRDMSKPIEQRWAHAGIDFNIPARNWTDANFQSLFQRYSELFWQRNLEADEYQLLQTAARDILLDLPADYTANEGLLTGLCGVYGSVPDFLFTGSL